MTNQDILFASLVGNKVAANVPAFNAIQNELSKHVLPPIPFLPLKNKSGIAQADSSPGQFKNWEATPPLQEEGQFFPFSIGIDGQKYLLPYEPMVTIGGKNILIRRYVAKAYNLIGTIKERWAQDDYEISVTGILMGSILTGNVEDCYPRADFVRLHDAMIRAEALTVYCEPLQLLGINKIAIEDFQFPFTKGENVQAYSFKMYSDYSYDLLLDIND